MVKPTFDRLSDEKKERMMDAITHEFSEHSFTEASINQIIKKAQISRGSFYQYFNDKEDCYLYLLQVIAQEKYILFQDVVQQSEHKNVFDEYISMLKRSILWMEEKPIYYKIGVLMDLDNSEFIRSLRQLNPEFINYFINLIRRDQNNGLICKEIDPVLLSDMLFNLNQSLMEEFFMKKDFEGMTERMKQIFEIIQYGTNVSKVKQIL